MSDSKTTMTLNVQAIHDAKDAIKKCKDEIMKDAQVLAELRANLRSVQDGYLNSPELKEAMTEFWDHSLEFSLMIQNVIELSDWIQSVPELAEQVAASKAILEKKKSK
jgi:uncharacterized phage infection (PIP) family protein YhgE